MLLQEYQERWAADFQEIKSVILPRLVGLDVRIEHIGSTAVPGLAAKPMIDLDIIYGGQTEFGEIKKRLETLGYLHRGNQGIPGREVFKRPDPDAKHEILDFIAHHLYVCPIDSQEARRHLLFRDFLRIDKTARNQYQQLKYEIAAEAGQDRKKYAQLKELKARNFIEGVLEQAERSGKYGF